MNFFQEQERARRDTGRLVVIFILAVVALIGVTILFVVGFYLIANDVPMDLFVSHPSEFVDPELVFGVGLVVLMIVSGGTFYKYASLSGGGKNVAVSLGGKLLNSNRADAQEKVLLNVLEEMAIASGIATPTVYVLEDESINAFAAGMTVDDAVIGITKGAIDKLSRDELQGVIAHEFSHIFNGDMRLNMNLMATLHGILLIGIIGHFIMRALSRSSSSSRSGKKGGGTAALFFFGLGLYIIGYVGTFFGQMIKAGVSRNREYLADATAVQYTRYPAGLSGALKKIAYYQSALSSPSADTYSHLYFAKGVSSLFATHPPLEQRILKIEPRWNGKIPDYDKGNVEAPATEKIKLTPEEKKEILMKGTVAAAMMRVGTIVEEEVEETREEVQQIDKELRGRLGDPLGAQAAVLALFYDAAYREALFAIVKEHNPYLLLELANMLRYEHDMLRKQSALIASLAINALKNLSVKQYRHFEAMMRQFVAMDGKTSLYEWSLEYIIARPLELHLGLRSAPKALGHTHLGAVKGDVELLYSLLLQAQFDSQEASRAAFDKAKKAIHAGALQYRDAEAITHEEFEAAVGAIELVKPGVAERIFEGMLYCVKIDSEVTPEENLFIHAAAQLIQVPLPREFRLEG